MQNKYSMDFLDQTVLVQNRAPLMMIFVDPLPPSN
jgi:hypothetical protein